MTKERLQVSDETIKQICEYLANTNYSHEEIARLTHTSVEYVHAIRSKRMRLDIVRNYNFDPTARKGRKLTEEDVKEIVDLLTSGLSTRKIADMYKVSKNTIQRIREGRTYQEYDAKFTEVKKPNAIGEDVVEYECNGLPTNILVSATGKVYSKNTHEPISVNVNTGHVMITRADGVKFTKHMDRIMGECFLHITPDQYIIHINNNPNDFNLDNLQIVSLKQKLKRANDLRKGKL